MKKNLSVDEMVKRLLAGDRRAAARLITLVEDEMDEHHEVMRQIFPHTGQAMILGITGAGGSGKSSLTDHLIHRFRARGKRVGVVVVDPSSPFSGGAFLGDRIRLQSHSQDDGVYIRSLASRGYLGGLSRATYDVIRIMEAMGNEVIIVETLGAGQDEIDIIHIAHTCLLVLTPGMGDDIQAMKAGIMEIADILVLNKADLDGASTSLRHLQGVLSAARCDEGEWIPRVVSTVSVADKPENLKGIDELTAIIGEHQAHLRKTRTIEQLKFERVEQELGLIFKDELEKLIFKSLKGTGKKKEYIASILERKNDPYSVVGEVLRTYLPSRE
ncbi:MAG: methylmalonyl Co-A mutase-associated GTPase MeaB [Desulfobacteraceae bacterium]|nr:methylmalonyl Co-A mutase-associated GTPase MeaB [Desulfobacterales bacterium]MBL6968400.1 methylmalonyl Co-A mutase-associated GTPase MeaB [Desulfobacteraceae bacterium]MBL7101636.1 methylmalonyl Co-A mutase-associated GTPase MeaB [Desulfobacteraceae bacterium]MBL7172029.1 methylmalonyl Co-A mutase-associated GTPase MeaB [Desulfobacteraceae bacterium]